MNDEKAHCSFCGKPNTEVRVMVSGPTAFICDECIEMCVEVVFDKLREEEQTNG